MKYLIYLLLIGFITFILIWVQIKYYIFICKSVLEICLDYLKVVGLNIVGCPTFFVENRFKVLFSIPLGTFFSTNIYCLTAQNL
jgi:hypothetical protein